MGYGNSFRPKSLAITDSQPEKPEASAGDGSEIILTDALNETGETDEAKDTISQTKSELMSDSDGARFGDNMIDRPKSVAGVQLLASDNDGASEFSKSADTHAFELEIDDLLHCSGTGNFSFLRSSFWVLGCTLFLALLLLYIFSQTVGMLHSIMLLPQPLCSIAIFLLTVLVCVIVYVIGRAVVFAFRLFNGSQLDIEQLISASNITGGRAYRISVDNFLQPYLRDFIARPEKIQSRFLQFSGADRIIESAHQLLDRKRRLSRSEWVEEFTLEIQRPMEAMAKDRISEYAKIVALKTAISPWPLVDMAAFIYNATLMFTDLATIFNRRLSRTNTIQMMAGLFFSIYIAGHTQEAVEALDAELNEHLSGISGDATSVGAGSDTGFFAESLFASLWEGVALFARFSARKIGEGAASWLLMKRLGRRTIKMLRPIAVD